VPQQRPSQSQAALVAALRECRGGLEAAIRARIDGDDAPTEAADPEYGAGLRAAVPMAIDYCLAAIERGEANPPLLPTGLLLQARVAARSKVPLAVVLRRYFAGYALLGDFMAEEADGAGLERASDLKRILRSLAAIFDRLVAAVGEEYGREAEQLAARTSGRRRADLIERLIGGEPLDGAELGYDFDACHLGAIAKGPRAQEALRSLATSLDRRLLCLEREEDAVWAWLGGRTPIDPGDVKLLVAANWPTEIALALGEPAEGRGGWRLTHRQARAVLPIALRSPQPLVRYADVALLASILGDDLLSTSLREMYLRPLEGVRDGGEALRETLRAYFASGRNAASAAALMWVSRQTVSKRLRTVEDRIARELDACASELELALQLPDQYISEASDSPNSTVAGRT
jgi:hypothetical protein